MKEKLYKRLGIVAFIVGFINCGLMLFSHFYIDFFTSLGIKGWFSLFCFYCILSIAGILIYIGKNYGIKMLYFYIIGSILDRVLVYVFYNEFVHYLDLVIPVSIALCFGYFVHFSKYSKYFKKEFRNQSVYITLLVLLIVIVPKLLL